MGLRAPIPPPPIEIWLDEQKCKQYYKDAVADEIKRQRNMIIIMCTAWGLLLLAAVIAAIGYLYA